MTNKIVLKKSSVVGRIPTTSDLEYGELALNYADGKLYYKTSLNTVGSIGGTSNTNLVQIDRQSYTATAGQTTFNITYSVPYVDVYVNGVHLSDEDYTATNGTTVVLTEACSAGDQVDLVGYSGGLISNAVKANGDLLIYNSSTGIWENFPQSSVSVGNANTANTLQTARTINGISFDGSANITVTTAGTGINVSGTIVSIDNTVVTLTDTQTLSNKFLTDDSTIFQNYSDNTRRAYFSLLGISPNSIRIMTLPDQSTTLVGRSTTDTLSNKSLTSFDQKTGSTIVANQAVIQSTVATTTQTAVDTFSTSAYRSAKYLVQITQGTNYQSSEIMILHNGTTTFTTEYAMLNTNGTLGSFSSDISGGNVRLLITMSSATSATINIIRTITVV